MFRFICKKLLQTTPEVSVCGHGRFLSSLSLKSISNFSSFANLESFTLSYLVNSCGLSLDSAISASKKIHIETPEISDSVLKFFKSHGFPESLITNFISKYPVLLLTDPDKTLKPKIELFESVGMSSPELAKILTAEPQILVKEPDLVIEFLKTHGFNSTQIKTFITKRPLLLLFNPDTNLTPKFEFFKSLGISNVELANMISKAPYILERSLENLIIPSVNFLKRFVQTNEKVVAAVKMSYRILHLNVERVMGPNISSLQSHGVPDSVISRLILIHPRSLTINSDRFNAVVEKVEKLGFKPTSLLFVIALRTMVMLSDSKWEQKIEAYRSFGWSKEETFSAFKLQPMCMQLSETKIRKLMDFFVNKLDWKPWMVAEYPDILLLSLENRIVPRCLVLQILMSKGLIKKDLSLAYLLKVPEKIFIKNFVEKYQGKAPKVVKAHQGKMTFQGFQGFSIGSKKLRNCSLPSEQGQNSS